MALHSVHVPFVVWAGRPACGPRPARRPRPVARGSPAARTRPASPCARAACVRPPGGRPRSPAAGPPGDGAASSSGPSPRPPAGAAGPPGPAGRRAPTDTGGPRCARACGGGSGAVPVRSRGSGGRPPGRSASHRCATAARRPSRRCWRAGRGRRDGSPRCPPAAAVPRSPPSRCGPGRRPARRPHAAGLQPSDPLPDLLHAPGRAWRDRPSCSVCRAASRRSPDRSFSARRSDAQCRRVAPFAPVSAQASARWPPAVPMAAARLSSKTRRRSRSQATFPSVARPLSSTTTASGDVASQHFGAAHEAAGVQHQAQRERRTVVALLPGMAAAGQQLPVRRALEAGAGPVVERDGGLPVEQADGALKKTRPDRLAVAQEAVAGALQGVPGHGLEVAAEQLAQGAALAQPVPRGARGGCRGRWRRRPGPPGPRGRRRPAPAGWRCAGPRPRPPGSRPRARGAAGERGSARRGCTALARPRVAGRRGGRGRG